MNTQEIGAFQPPHGGALPAEAGLLPGEGLARLIPAEKQVLVRGHPGRVSGPVVGLFVNRRGLRARVVGGDPAKRPGMVRCPTTFSSQLPSGVSLSRLHGARLPNGTLPN